MPLYQRSIFFFFLYFVAFFFFRNCACTEPTLKRLKLLYCNTFRNGARSKTVVYSTTHSRAGLLLALVMLQQLSCA